jgi:cytochrome c biogenesis protein
MRYLRLFWVQLTSMRTALLLLFTLAVVAIPGSLLPQRPVAPIRVSDWKAANPAVADLYEKLGLFDVYHSPWFAAVYLLLMISLVGCIIPRIGVYARALRTPPPRTPRHLTGCPPRVQGSSTLTADEALTNGEKVLASRGSGPGATATRYPPSAATCGSSATSCSTSASW